MIIEMLYMAPYNALLNLINGLPVISTGYMPIGWISKLISLLYVGLQFVPADTILISISCVVGWAGVHFLIGLLRFVKTTVPFA